MIDKCDCGQMVIVQDGCAPATWACDCCGSLRYVSKTDEVTSKEFTAVALSDMYIKFRQAGF